MSATKIQLSFFSSSNLLAWISYPWKRYQTLSNLTYLVRWFINLQWIAKLTLALCKTAFFNMMLMSFTLVNFLYCFSWFFFPQNNNTFHPKSIAILIHAISTCNLFIFLAIYALLHTLSHTIPWCVQIFVFFIWYVFSFSGKSYRWKQKKNYAAVS
jgi:hypothetical protein